jgi:hypothetical protein
MPAAEQPRFPVGSGSGFTKSAQDPEFEQKRIQPEQRTHQQHPAVTVLYVGGMYDGLHQQALGINEDVALLTLDFLPGIVACRV